MTTETAPKSPGETPDGRTLHYGGFYGVTELDEDDRPLVVIMGNCQAEALRNLLDAAPSKSVRTVRIPPVFEMNQADIAHLDALLARTDVLVAQPIKDGYGGLPLGIAEVTTRLKAGAQVVRFPTCFWAGLYPWQILVRTPESGDPPGVPYHDLRTVLEVATGTRPSTPPRIEGIREVADRSEQELRRREQASDTIVVSDLLRPAGGDACHVLNHPGNSVLLGLARRVQERIGVRVDAVEPGRVLLSEIFAPLLPEVVDALGLDTEPRAEWVHRGEQVPDEQIRDVQLSWLREHPEIVDLAMQRHAETARLLGW